uniref:Uncharacterized protein n=1 Tax=Rhizophora mucronata TaxID=61149 RepID=A0A2P2Q7D2_RHIMU
MGQLIQSPFRLKSLVGEVHLAQSSYEQSFQLVMHWANS